jgi:hypothetical protein
MIRIVSGGTAASTKVFAEDGSELTGITCFEVLPVLPGKPVSARITFEGVELDVVADDGAVPGVEAWIDDQGNATPFCVGKAVDVVLRALDLSTAEGRDAWGALTKWVLADVGISKIHCDSGADVLRLEG